MSEFEVLIWAVFSLAVLATFMVMLIRRPGEIKKEKFEKRDWQRPDKLGVELGQTHSHFSVMEISESELNSTAFARDDSVHFSRRIIYVDVLGYKYVVGLHRKAIPVQDRADEIGFAEQLVRLVLPN